MRTGTLRTTGLTAAALTAAVLLAACDGTDGDGGSASPSSAGDATTVASPTGESGTGGTDGTATPAPTTGASGGSGTTGSAGDRCTAADLTVTAGDPDGAAGSVYRTLSFANSSDHDCSLRGYPGVSMVAGDDQVGAAADRENSSDGTPTVTLSPGDTATADLKITNPGVYDSCTATPADGLRIYPPEDTASTVVEVDGLTGCTGDDAPVTLRISPVRG